MSKRAFVFGVDLDGTVADFYGGLRPIAAEWLGVTLESLPTEISWGIPEWGLDTAPGGYEALHKFAVTQRGLFRELQPLSGRSDGVAASIESGCAHPHHHPSALHQIFSSSRSAADDRLVRSP